jgi:hypothetical protein
MLSFLYRALFELESEYRKKPTSVFIVVTKRSNDPNCNFSEAVQPLLRRTRAQHVFPQRNGASEKMNWQLPISCYSGMFPPSPSPGRMESDRATSKPT